MLNNNNLVNFINSIFIHIILIFGILRVSISHPLYDVYNLENEPAPIPMHFLKIPMQTNSDVGYSENDVIGKAFKRNQNQILNPNNANSNSCCPTIIDVVEPTHGKNRSGDLVELFQSETVRQRFYENSCSPSVVDHPCRFLDRRHSSHSKCTQQYSYTYAMVRDMASENTEWKFDYIQVRSGCSCHITNT